MDCVFCQLDHSILTELPALYAGTAPSVKLPVYPLHRPDTHTQHGGDLAQAGSLFFTQGCAYSALGFFSNFGATESLSIGASTGQSSAHPSRISFVSTLRENVGPVAARRVIASLPTLEAAPSNAPLVAWMHTDERLQLGHRWTPVYWTAQRAILTDRTTATDRCSRRSK